MASARAGSGALAGPARPFAGHAAGAATPAPPVHTPAARAAVPTGGLFRARARGGGSHAWARSSHTSRTHETQKLRRARERDSR